MRIALCLITLLAASHTHAAENRGKPWKRHTVDNSSRGADGVRVADVNGDGLPDFVTGWEEGGQVRVCLNPGPAKAKQPWPAVTVGMVRSPEDAVFVDLDNDGAIDVVSCCEGRVRTMFVHWAPKDRSKYLDPSAWKTEPIPPSKNMTSWMFAMPMQVDGKHGVDLIAGSKAKNAQIGWWEAPGNPRDLAAWKWHRIDTAGWIMSLISEDVDGDGDLDIITTDRKGKRRGCRWLENPGHGSAQSKPWRAHEIGGTGKEVMFMVSTDLNRDGRKDYAIAVKGDGILLLTRTADKTPTWTSDVIPLPVNTGSAKGAHVGDINRDGKLDLVFTCENSGKKSGVMWLSHDPKTKRWTPYEISGTKTGIKFDLVQLIDLDGDGDLDVITCEERNNLGVIWYENPTR